MQDLINDDDIGSLGEVVVLDLKMVFGTLEH
jgi:hypothetical protein